MLTYKSTLVIVGSLLGAFFLSGCETVDTTRTLIKQKGATTADQGLIDAEWLVCNAASIGSVNRRYGQTIERADTYKDFCHGDGRANVVSPE